MALLHPPSVLAAIYYASPTGAGAQTGSASEPFGSLWSAASTLQPGDELRLYGGTYNQKLFALNSGTSTNRIRITNVSGQQPVIDLQNANEPGIYSTAEYVDFSNIRVTNIRKDSSGICVYVEKDNVSFDNLVVDHCYTHGILMLAKNIQLTNSNVSYTNLSNQSLQPGAQYGSGVKVAMGGENILIQGNTIHHNYGEGIAVTRGKNVQMIGNTSFDNSPSNYYLDNSINVTADRNYSYCSGDPGFKKNDGTYPEGFSIGEENYSSTWGSQLGNITVTNNLIDSCSSGIFYWGSDFSNGGLRGALVAHNTIWNARFEGMHFNDSPATTNVVIANNIIGTATTAIRKGVFRNTSGTTVHHNFWVGGHSSNDENAIGVGDLTGDVKLATTPVVGSPLTLALSSTSPAINKGGILNPYVNLTTDFVPASRDSQPDMGALEHQTAGASPSPSLSSSPSPSINPSPNASPTSCQSADINQDGIVNILDYTILTANFFSTAPNPARADINQDGTVNILDFSILVGQFFENC